MSSQKRLRKLLQFDQRLKRSHQLTGKPVAGVDEAGRGPLAGPLVASAVILHRAPRGVPIDDSKLLSPKDREVAFPRIVACAAVGVGVASVHEIDRLGIQSACHKAMLRALEGLAFVPSAAMIDGPWVPPGCPILGIPIVNGDARSLAIACASIVAKVLRDRWMIRADRLYPEYGFLRHKGYGTPEHVKALKSIGPSSFHRFSFEPIKSFSE